MRTLLLLAAAALLPAQIGSKSVVPISVGRKVALVIGNSVYRNFDAIPAASNDADDMAASLRRLGFDVAVKKNLGVEALIDEIGGFSAAIHGGDLAVLYYSGHGGSVGEENYLLPVDYDPPARQDLVEHRAFAMSKVRDAMERSGALVRVLIFDACRSSALSEKGADPEPRPIEGRPEGTLIAFASAHKQGALFDARERNSLYTKRLLAALASPGMDLRGLLEGVQGEVYRDTQHQQTPYLYGFLSGPLYLAGAPRTDAGPKPDAATDTWNFIRDSRDPDDFEKFAKAFPESPFARGAEIRAAQLRKAMVAVNGAPANPPAAAPMSEMPHAKTWTNPKDGLTYVWIEPGTFMMGCSPGDGECYPDEKPAHQVTITRGYWMGQTDVTQEAYQRVLAKNPSHFKGVKLPVENVSWTDSRNYCAATGMRLPTEAEWEYAARAGNPASRYGDIDSIAWYYENSGNTTHPVMQKQPNDWGLYDMLGNVWQWTADWYTDKHSGSKEMDPKGPSSGQYRVLRAESWGSYPRDVRVSGRVGVEPGVRDVYIVGFRCAGN